MKRISIAEEVRNLKVLVVTECWLSLPQYIYNFKQSVCVLARVRKREREAWRKQIVSAT